MRTNGLFKCHRAVINFPEVNKPFSIVFFGDVHKFSEHHCEATWKRFLNTYRHRENVWFFGMGDYLDLMSASERFAVVCSKLHESTRQTMQEFYDKLIADFAKDLGFMRGRVLGLLEGNHFIEDAQGITSTQKLCAELGAPYLGACCASIVTCRHIQRNGRPSAFKRDLRLALHHGRGCGRRAGAGFNNVEEMARTFEGCDIYAMGDNHQRGCVPIQTLRLTANNAGGARVDQHQIMLLRTGAFLRGYVDGKKSYVVDALYAPSNLGWCEIEVTPQRDYVTEEYGFHLVGKS